MLKISSSREKLVRLRGGGGRDEKRELHCYEMHNSPNGARFINGIEYGERGGIKGEEVFAEKPFYEVSIQFKVSCLKTSLRLFAKRSGRSRMIVENETRK
jgi:hypothetical protein